MAQLIFNFSERECALFAILMTHGLAYMAADPDADILLSEAAILTDTCVRKAEQVIEKTPTSIGIFEIMPSPEDVIKSVKGWVMERNNALDKPLGEWQIMGV